MTRPTNEALKDALSAAGSAHHEFEVHALGGERDERWAGWYAAYTLGRLGEFVAPSRLARWLEETSSDGDWFEAAAAQVARRLDSQTE